MIGTNPAAPGRIFMCYRRDEADYPAGWLYERLVARFGREQIFKDVDSIELGDDFVESIANAVGTCDALVAFIGDRWLTITDEEGNRRIDNPNDFVRIEIEAALKRNVRVIPILIGNAEMPRAEDLPASLVALSRRQALELNPNRFMSATGHLLRVLDRTIAEATARREAEALTEIEVAKRDVSRPSKRPWRRRGPEELGAEGTVGVESEVTLADETEVAPMSAPNPGAEALSRWRPSRWAAITIGAAVAVGIALVMMQMNTSPPDAVGGQLQSPTTVNETPSSTTMARKAPTTTLAPLDSAGIPTNWKRFVDRRQHFAFSYPPDWSVRNQSFAAAVGPGGLSIDVIVYPGSRVRDPLQVLKDYAPTVDNIKRSIRLEGGKFAGHRAGFWEYFLETESDHRLTVNFFRESDRFSIHFVASEGRGWSQLTQIMKYFERSFEVD
jgi:TIR domain